MAPIVSLSVHLDSCCSLFHKARASSGGDAKPSNHRIVIAMVGTYLTPCRRWRRSGCGDTIRTSMRRSLPLCWKRTEDDEAALAQARQQNQYVTRVGITVDDQRTHQFGMIHDECWRRAIISWNRIWSTSSNDQKGIPIFLSMIAM